MLIFDSKTIPITQFGINNKDVEILGTFPTLNDPKGLTTIQDIKTVDGNFEFPFYGEFYVRTNSGSFKTLLQDPSASQDERILQICDFISNNTLCVPHDTKYFYFPDQSPEFRLSTIDSILFHTERPIRLYCDRACKYCYFVLRRKEHFSKVVELYEHYVLEVFLPNLQKDAFVDLTFGMKAYSDSQMHLDSILSCRSLQEHYDQHKPVYYKNNCHNHFLEGEYEEQEENNSSDSFAIEASKLASCDWDNPENHPKEYMKEYIEMIKKSFVGLCLDYSWLFDSITSIVEFL